MSYWAIKSGWDCGMSGACDATEAGLVVAALLLGVVLAIFFLTGKERK